MLKFTVFKFWDTFPPHFSLHFLSHDRFLVLKPLSAFIREKVIMCGVWPGLVWSVDQDSTGNYHIWQCRDREIPYIPFNSIPSSQPKPKQETSKPASKPAKHSIKNRDHCYVNCSQKWMCCELINRYVLTFKSRSVGGLVMLCYVFLYNVMVYRIGYGNW